MFHHNQRRCRGSPAWGKAKVRVATGGLRLQKDGVRRTASGLRPLECATDVRVNAAPSASTFGARKERYKYHECAPTCCRAGQPACDVADGLPGSKLHVTCTSQSLVQTAVGVAPTAVDVTPTAVGHVSFTNIDNIASGGVSAQRGHSAQQPVTTLQTTHHRGSYGHRVTTADVDSNLTFWELYSALTHCLSLWAE